MRYTKSIEIPQQLSKLTKESPVRILHVVGGMNRGGLETWLMHILRNIDRDYFHMDFLVHTTEPCAYDAEVRSLGSRIIPCLNPSQPWLYAHNFKSILKKYGPYDVVHSHVHQFSGYVLRLAQQAGIPIRIAHSHIDASPLEANSGIFRRLYLNITKGLIAHHATVGLGCSEVATVDLFGNSWKQDSRWQLLYYGIDMTRFQESVNAGEIRQQFNIPGEAFVIGHIGRFEEQKNHRFLLEIFAEIAQREPLAYLLLIGEGSLRPTIEEQALKMGLSERIIFAGSRSDIPQLMLGAMDVFLLPSLSEGLPMVGIEAQSAGLPLILSDVITDELLKIKPLIQKISLSQSAKVWAKAVLSAKNLRGNITQLESINTMVKSQFNISCSIKSLTKIYAQKES
ncbi:MAG: glycosyltransferase family 1 protein [Nostocaceae cyanobacterium]|nr:glycosyltransferase family 1 protein [Nostocaceae cyanobacterium]